MSNRKLIIGHLKKNMKLLNLKKVGFLLGSDGIHQEKKNVENVLSLYR